MRDDLKTLTSAIQELTQAMKNASQVPASRPSDDLERFVQEQSKLVNLSVVNDLPELPKPQMVALPSKMELAKEWLKEHPEDRQLTGRELEENRKPHNVKISYVYWNKAKNEV